jgi:hypothetical protein
MHKDIAWLFAEPPNEMTVTSRQITDRRKPILLVSRDEEDGDWQFLTGEAFNMADAMLVGLQTIVNLDPSVSQSADLAPGWQASRESTTHPWVRAKSENTDA